VELVQIPNEQTTAATDLLLGMLSILFSILVIREHSGNRFHRKMWFLFFLFLGLASFLGAIVHGIDLNGEIKHLLWNPLYLFLALSVAFFVLGAIFEICGEKGSRKSLPFMLCAAGCLFLVTVFIPDSFLIFIIYEALGLMTCLGIFLGKVFQTRETAYLFMITGILLTALAAVLQSRADLVLYLIWEFDHNGIFHLVQVPGLILIFLSVRKLLVIKNNPDH